jgi:AraC-like DNA-binding protein
MIDEELSKLDTVGYVQSSRPKRMPSLLDVSGGGETYAFELLTAHLWEKHWSARLGRTSHHHDVYHVVLYVGGDGTFHFEGDQHRARSGRLVLVSPRQQHTFSPATGWVVYHEITFALRSSRRALTDPFDSLLGGYVGRALALTAIQDLDARTYALVKSNMEKIVSALRDTPTDWFATSRQLIDLFGRLATVSAGAAEDMNREGLRQRAETFIMENFADSEFSLKAMSTALHVSGEHLCRHFRETAGVSPMAYRNQLRMQAARNLLRSTSLPCKTIADRLGYSDLYAFSKAYYRMTGKRPSHERARGKAEIGNLESGNEDGEE